MVTCRNCGAEWDGLAPPAVANECPRCTRDAPFLSLVPFSCPAPLADDDLYAAAAEGKP